MQKPPVFLPKKVFQRMFLRGVALLLCLCLTAQDAAALALPAEGPSALIDLPAGTGKVSEVWQGGASGKMVFLVEDAHDSVRAQKNIARIILQLVRQRGIGSVYEEGYEGPVPTDDFYGEISNPRLRYKVSLERLKKLRIGGAEFAHINRFYDAESKASDFQLIGADSLQGHLQNILAYRAAAGMQPAILNDLNGIEKKLRNLASLKLDAKTRDWLKLRDRYLADETDLTAYLRRSIPFYLEEADVRRFSQDYPALSKLAEALDTKDAVLMKEILQVHTGDFYRELAVFDEALFARISRKAPGLAPLAEALQFLPLARKLARMELNPLEYEKIKGKLEKFQTRDIAGYAAEALKETVVFSRRWETQIKPALEFYEAALSREDAARTALEQFSESSEKETILVFGGFHAPRLKEMMRGLGLSYAVLTPNLGSLSARDRTLYRRLMAADERLHALVPQALTRLSRVLSDFEWAASGLVPQEKVRSEILVHSDRQPLDTFRPTPRASASRSEVRSPAAEVEVLKGGRPGAEDTGDELLSVLDRDGRPTGETKPREILHQSSDWHAVSHVYLFDPEGRLLLQKRASHLSQSPGTLQVSVSGHVNAGESPLEAALREGEEELGIRLASERLIPVTVVRNQYAYSSEASWENREFVTVFVYQVSPEELKQIGENYNLNESEELWLVNPQRAESLAVETPHLFSNNLKKVFSERSELWRTLVKEGDPEHGRHSGLPKSYLTEKLEQIVHLTRFARLAEAPAAKEETVRALLRFFESDNLSIREALYKSLRGLPDIEQILLVLIQDQNVVTASGAILFLAFLFKSKGFESGHAVDVRQQIIQEIEIRLSGSAGDEKNAASRALIQAFGYLLDDETVSQLIDYLEKDFTAGKELETSFLDSAASSGDPKVHQKVLNWYVSRFTDAQVSQIPFSLSRLLNSHTAAGLLGTDIGRRIALRFGYIDEGLFAMLEAGAADPEVLQAIQTLITALGLASEPLVKKFISLSEDKKETILGDWESRQFEWMRMLLPEELTEDRALRPVSVEDSEEGVIDRMLFFGALRESDWANAQDKRETNPFGYDHREKHGGRFFYAAESLFYTLWREKLKKVEAIMGEFSDADVRNVLKPYFAADAMALETEPRKEPREEAEARFLGRWRSLAGLLEIRNDKLQLKEKIAKRVALEANLDGASLVVSLNDSAAVSVLISKLAAARSAWKYALLDPNAMSRSHLFIGRASRDPLWKTLSYGSRSALKLLAYERLSDASLPLEDVWPDWEREFHRLAAEEAQLRGKAPSLGMELQSVNVSAAQVYLWKQALPFFDIPSPERLRYGHIVETAFRPAWTPSAYVMAVPILHRMGLMGKEKYRRAAAFHISLAGDLGREARWIAFPLMMFGRSTQDEDEEQTLEQRALQSAWVLSKGYIHLNRVNQKADPQSPEPEFHTEIRTARFSNTEKGKDEMLDDHEQFLPAVQNLGAALTAWNRKQEGAAPLDEQNEALAAIWSGYQRALADVVSELPQAQALIDADWYESTGDSKDANLVMQLSIFQRMNDLYQYKKQNPETYPAFTEKVRKVFLDASEQAGALLRSEIRIQQGAQDKRPLETQVHHYFSTHSPEIYAPRDGTIYGALPVHLISDVFEQIGWNLKVPLQGKTFFEIGAGDMRNSLLASALGMKVISAEKDDIIFENLSKPVYEDFQRNPAWTEALQQFDLRHADVLSDQTDDAWKNADVVFFYYTEPGSAIAMESGASFRKRIQEKMQLMKPGALLALVVFNSFEEWDQIPHEQLYVLPHQRGWRRRLEPVDADRALQLYFKTAHFPEEPRSTLKSEVRTGQPPFDEAQRRLAHFLWEAAGAQPNQPLHWQEHTWTLAGALIDSGIFRDRDISDADVRQIAHTIWLAKTGPNRTIHDERPPAEKLPEYAHIRGKLLPWLEVLSQRKPVLTGRAIDSFSAPQNVVNEFREAGLYVYQANYQGDPNGGDYYRIIRSRDGRYGLIELADGMGHGEHAMQAEWFAQAIWEAEIDLGAPLLVTLARSGETAVHERVRDYLEMLQMKVDEITEERRGEDHFGFYTHTLIFIDYETGRVQEWRAGHHPSVVETHRNDQTVWFQHVPSAAPDPAVSAERLLPIGWMMQGVSLSAVKQSSASYEDASKLLIYTDGAWPPTRGERGLEAKARALSRMYPESGQLFQKLQPEIVSEKNLGTGLENDDVTFLLLDITAGRRSYENRRRSEIRSKRPDDFWGRVTVPAGEVFKTGKRRLHLFSGYAEIDRFENAAYRIPDVSREAWALEFYPDPEDIKRTDIKDWQLRLERHMRKPGGMFARFYLHDNGQTLVVADIQNDFYRNLGNNPEARRFYRDWFFQMRLLIETAARDLGVQTLIFPDAAAVQALWPGQASLPFYDGFLRRLFRWEERWDGPYHLIHQLMTPFHLILILTEIMLWPYRYTITQMYEQMLKKEEINKPAKALIEFLRLTRLVNYKIHPDLAHIVYDESMNDFGFEHGRLEMPVAWEGKLSLEQAWVKNLDAGNEQIVRRFRKNYFKRGVEAVIAASPEQHQTPPSSGSFVRRLEGDGPSPLRSEVRTDQNAGRQWAENRRPAFTVKPEEVLIFHKSEGDSVGKNSANSFWKHIPVEHRGTTLLTPLRSDQEGIVLLTRNHGLREAIVNPEERQEDGVTYEVFLNKPISEDHSVLLKRGVSVWEKKKWNKPARARMFKVETIEKVEGNGSVWRFLLRQKESRLMMPALRSLGYLPEKIVRRDVFGVSLNGLKKNQFRVASWDELHAILGHLKIDQGSLQTMNEKFLQAVEEEKIDRQLILEQLKSPGFLKDIFSMLFARPDLSAGDVRFDGVEHIKDMRHMGEGGFKRVYRVALHLPDENSDFTFVIKVVKADVKKSDSGYVYDKAYLDQLDLAIDQLRSKYLYLHPPATPFYSVTDSLRRTRYIAAERLVPATQASITDVQRDRLILQSYFLLYRILEKKFVFDPKRPNALVTKKDRNHYAATLIDLDNLYLKSMGGAEVIQHFLDFGFDPNDIIYAAIQTLGTEEGQSFLQSASMVFKSMSLFREFTSAYAKYRSAPNKQALLPAVRLPETVAIHLNGLPRTVPDALTLYELLSDYGVQFQKTEIHLNGTKITPDQKLVVWSDRKNRQFYSQRLRDGDFVSFVPVNKIAGEATSLDERKRVSQETVRQVSQKLKKAGFYERREAVTERLSAFRKTIDDTATNRGPLLRTALRRADALIELLMPEGSKEPQVVFSPVPFEEELNYLERAVSRLEFRSPEKRADVLQEVLEIKVEGVELAHFFREVTSRRSEVRRQNVSPKIKVQTKRVLIPFEEIAQQFTNSRERLDEIAILAAIHPEVRFDFYGVNQGHANYLLLRQFFKGIPNVHFWRQRGNRLITQKKENSVKVETLLHVSESSFDVRERFGAASKGMRFIQTRQRGGLSAALLYNPEHWLFRIGLRRQGDFWVLQDSLARLGQEWLAHFVIHTAA